MPRGKKKLAEQITPELREVEVEAGEPRLSRSRSPEQTNHRQDEHQAAREKALA